jgi:hypothetical protein
MDLTVGANLWIFEDGGFSSVDVGQRIELAVEVTAVDGWKSGEGEPGMRQVEGPVYEAVVRVVHINEEDRWFFADFGHFIFGVPEAAPEGAEVGSVLTATVHFGVDPLGRDEGYESPNSGAAVVRAEKWVGDEYVVDVTLVHGEGEE